jgi:hypothetical protein
MKCIDGSRTIVPSSCLAVFVLEVFSLTVLFLTEARVVEDDLSDSIQGIVKAIIESAVKSKT